MSKLQLILLFFFSTTSTLVKAQTNNCLLVGKVDSQFVSSYAFLYMPERKITIHTAINNSEFQFSIEKRTKFETAILYFGIDSTRKFSDMQLSRRPGIKETVIVALEDSVHISLSNDLKMAKVVGGTLNRDLTEMDDAIKSGNYLNFFATHPNSPVALLFLKSLVRIKNNPMLNQSLDCELYYSKLSEDLRKSAAGLAVWDMITK